MAFGIDDAVAAVASIGGKIIDRVWPDPVQAAEAKLKLLEMQQNGELAQMTAETDLMKGQLEINKVEAQSTNWFVAAWRPAVGWCCCAGLCMQFVIGPNFTFVAGLLGSKVIFPQQDLSTLLPLLFGLLGFGGMRTVEKIKGIDAGH
jgi:hypothetical protein